MPQRRSGNAINADMLRSEIVAMQAAAATAEQGFGADGGATLTLDDLNETERSAALIGVSPDAYKPIPWVRTTHDAPLTSPQPAARSPQPSRARRAPSPFPQMNTHHYAQLLKGNNLDGRLAQQLEAYKTVSQQ